MAITILPDVLKTLFTTLVTVHPQSVSDSLGDTVELPEQTFYGYVFEDMEKVVTANGDEVISGTQIYLKGSDMESIDIHSKVTCNQAIKQPILSRKLYRGRNSEAFIGILYLP